LYPSLPARRAGEAQKQSSQAEKLCCNANVVSAASAAVQAFRTVFIPFYRRNEDRPKASIPGKRAQITQNLHRSGATDRNRLARQPGDIWSRAVKSIEIVSWTPNGIASMALPFDPGDAAIPHSHYPGFA